MRMLTFDEIDAVYEADRGNNNCFQTQARDLIRKFCEVNGLAMDNCEFCLGTKGGVPGNENRIDGHVVCDYCHVLLRMRNNEPKPGGEVSPTTPKEKAK